LKLIINKNLNLKKTDLIAEFFCYTNICFIVFPKLKQIPNIQEKRPNFGHFINVVYFFSGKVGIIRFNHFFQIEMFHINCNTTK